MRFEVEKRDILQEIESGLQAHKALGDKITKIFLNQEDFELFERACASMYSFNIRSHKIYTYKGIPVILDTKE